MMAFLPLNVHPNPRNVLIVGGGDGGVAREVLKHPLVESVVLCEIDEAVVRVSKQFLPHMSSSFDDPRLEVKIEDGLNFVKNCDEKFDIIITDSSDPVGPAVGLFNRNYYESLYNALESGGIICSQAEDFWFDLDIVKDLHTMCKSLFTNVAYASILVPTYPSGQIGCMLASKDLSRNFSKAVIPHDRQFLHSLRYYTEKVHEAAFALPNFVIQKLES
jgi:spermidine synthase